ncbi:MAG: hypothetical protein Q8O57_00040 [Kiritimatiellota bacterium]|nr:hypothetical protein [Kiritimatiellota bacterium]
MVTSDERIKILKMVQEGKITADQASELLQVLEERSTPERDAFSAMPPAPAGRPGSGRWFRVRISDIESGKTRANIRLPVGIISAGIKMGMKFSPGMEGLDPQQLAEIIQSGEIGTIVDVYDEEDKEHVEVFIE